MDDPNRQNRTFRQIRTERTVLREWRDEDADFALDLYSRDDVLRYLGPTSGVRSRDEALASIARRRATCTDPVHGVWLMEARDGARLGNLLLKPIPVSAGEEDRGEVEIGWHLHPDAWGHGYATEAAAAVLADAAARGLDRVVAVTHPENAASQAVCRRIGMTPLGRTRRFYDTECELFEWRAPDPVGGPR